MPEPHSRGLPLPIGSGTAGNRLHSPVQGDLNNQINQDTLLLFHPEKHRLPQVALLIGTLGVHPHACSLPPPLPPLGAVGGDYGDEYLTFARTGYGY